MQQLTGIDTLFLTQETERTPLHISPLLIYDPSTAPGGRVRFKDILRLFENRLHLAPIFRRRLVEVPFGLDYPYWVEAEDFDLEFHVRHIALPQPGDWRQLCIQVARLHARILDRSHPLWEAYVIEGLDNIEGLPKGSFALFLKMHHAAIDGVSGAEIIGAIHDAEPRAVVAPDSTAPQRWHPDSPPSQTELLARAWLSRRGSHRPWAA
jgi:WS/DGAT/MGAT family acyltransferase